MVIILLSRQRTTKALIRLSRCAGWSVPLLFADGINRFSHDVALLEVHLNFQDVGIRFTAKTSNVWAKITDYWCYRLYSVLSLTLQLERHSREDGWRMSGVVLTGVWVEFSIGIHYLHPAFPHWSDTRRCENVIREVLRLQAWKRHSFGIVGIALKYFGS